MPSILYYITFGLFKQFFWDHSFQTPEYELKSKLGMLIKADMIRTLIHKSMYPDDIAKRDEIYEKYKKFVVPVGFIYV